MADYDLLHDGEEIDACIDEVVAARGSEASLSERLSEIVSNFETDQQRQETEIGAVAAMGAKNLLRDQSLNAASVTGVTITPNGDGTYTLSGTPTGTATYLYTLSSNLTNLIGLEAGNEYTISSGSDKVLIRVDYSINGTSWETTPIINNLPESANFTLPDTAIGIYIRFRSTAAAGSLDGIVVKPMLRRAEITDSTYVPYAPTNRELYETKIALPDAFGLGTALTTGLDLNNITGIGIYYAPSTTIAQSLANCPASYTFRLEVKTINGENRYMQSIYEVSTSTGQITIYRRAYTANGWKSWYRFTGEAVAAAQSAASLMQAGRIDAELTDAKNDEAEVEER